MAGHLYLMSRQFDKEVSDARSHLKEIKNKHSFNGVDFKENKVILKCLFEDLEEVCEQQEEVNGSDDGNANDVVTSATKIIKTRRELTALLNQAIHKLNYSEKTQKELSDELKRVRQDLYHLEKTKKTFEQELLKAKQGIEKSEKTKKKFKQELLKAKQGMKNSEKTRSELCDELIEVKHDLDDLKTTQKELNDELKRVRQDLYYSEKTKKKFKQELLKAKQGMNNSEKTRSELCDELIEVKHDLDDLKTTQKELSDELKRVRQDLYHSEKTRSELCDELIEVKHDLDDLKTERAILQTKFPLIKEQLKWTQPTVTVVVKSGRYNIILDFTFPDGIQTLHQSPGKPIKGGTFTGRLYRDSEGQLLCRMLKAALKKGVMFNSGKNGEVILEGISLYNDKVFTKWKKTSAYDKYIPTLRAELAVKGITAENIDQEEELEETFTVYGSKSR
ncbi:myosin-11-like isoform X1 [Mya arenaria]|uniref:myosin-11-like isoform X1 n=1 Tax=Mya arenaria TaxID=6604 RepID=UPI0022E1A9F5|nr:myosin-11-like isoform X1 [Mya arenaria]